MAGPNLSATEALARAVSIPVIASGGVSSLADLLALRDTGRGIAGAISGRALYDGAINLKGRPRRAQFAAASVRLPSAAVIVATASRSAGTS